MQPIEIKIKKSLIIILKIKKRLNIKFINIEKYNNFITVKKKVIGVRIPS